MPPKQDVPPSASQELLVVQREANEQLLLSALRSQEREDSAKEAQRTAEDETLASRTRELALCATAEFRERLIGMIGHDLRSPLNTIAMASQLLADRDSLSENDVLLVNRIARSAQRMTRMIAQLVEFTRAKLGGGFDLTLVPTDLGAVCQDIADELRIGSDTEIRQTVDGDVKGVWDSDRLGEVISNIAGNAVEHATHGTPVRIHSYDDGDWVTTDIENQGVGISPELVAVIFTAFRRVQTSAPTRKSKHFGLGLYIAAEIVRAHQGTLSVESRDGTTTFTMRLPRVVTVVGHPADEDQTLPLPH